MTKRKSDLTKGRGRSAFQKFVSSDWGRLLVIDVVAVAIMSMVSKEYLSTFNLFVITRDVSTMILIGFSQAIVLAIGQMNLSLGAIGGLVAVTSGGLMAMWGWPIWLAVLVGLLIGVLAGYLNGMLIVWTGINSFIITVATNSIFLGLNLGMTHAKPFYNISATVKAFGQARFGFFPYMGVVTIILIVLMVILLKYVVFGRQILATGGNWNAAEISGVPVKRSVVLAHIISGFMAAVAGMLWMSQLGSAQPMIGVSWLLPSFAIPIIGGVALTGGGASIGGIVLAAFLLSIIQSALVHLQVDPYYVQFLLGLLILSAVVLNELGGRRRRA